jgi:thiol-disulfide isomerase/thioredoxin
MGLLVGVEAGTVPEVKIALCAGIPFILKLQQPVGSTRRHPSRAVMRKPCSAGWQWQALLLWRFYGSGQNANGWPRGTMTAMRDVNTNLAPVGGNPRRRLLATLAVSAGSAAAGLALFTRLSDPLPNSESDMAAKPLAMADDAFWALVFDTPAGGRLAMQSFRGKPLLVNFWATWCPPCVEELPLINAFYLQKASKAFQVLGIAADGLTAVKEFLGKKPVAFPVVLAGMAGVELSHRLGNLSGGLPFTMVLDGQGGVVQRKIGRITAQDLATLGQLMEATA